MTFYTLDVKHENAQSYEVRGNAKSFVSLIPNGPNGTFSSYFSCFCLSPTVSGTVADRQAS